MVQLSFTLDTNCMIAVDEGRDEAIHVINLLEAARAGRADVAMVASSASEKQKSGDYLQNLETFLKRMAELGFGDLVVLPPIARFDISFFDSALYADEQMLKREQEIFEALFPASKYSWQEYATSRGVAPDNFSSNAGNRWRNQILDAQAFWAHDYASRDYFVTSDRRFWVLEKEGIAAVGSIVSPEQAFSKL